MANKLEELKFALGAGARASKYRVNFSIPTTIGTSSNLQNANILCKASNFPGSTLGVIEVYNQGRKLTLPGDTAYTNAWTVSFYNTEDHALRKDMISWQVAADHFQTNIHSGSPADILGELSVEQLDSAGNVTARYTFHNVFVSEVGEIAVADESVDTLQEFDVTFTFSDWVVGDNQENNPAAGNAATENITAY